jgi:nicotinate-nucleotide adenylyltransferase
VTGWPVAHRGEVIGLLGGSFDPPHEGHVRITLAALRRFGLSRIWWLVSPGNPLKPAGPAPMADRLRAARALMAHPRVVVTDLESRLGTRYTAATLKALLRRYPGVRFVWLMGADNLADFHRWQDWRGIVARVPIGVLARPGEQLHAGLSRAARTFRAARRPAHAARGLGRGPAPDWCFVNLPLSAQSSTAIRACGQWTRAAGKR